MAIIYPRFGVSAGRLGNQMFQWAAMIGMAKRYGCEFMVPEWKYSQYFENPPKQYTERPAIQAIVNEGPFNYTPQWWDQYADEFRAKNVSIFGWLQSWKYWEDAREQVRKDMTFKPEFVEQVKAKAPDGLFTRPIIAISVRRGDFVNNENYHQLPAKYYIMALLHHFPDFRENYNVMIFSDDLAYCKVHFGCLRNAYFADGLSDIEQLCLGSMCRSFILANSTFSYWMAMLADLNGTADVIVRPAKIFDGPLKDTDISDHYPPHWVVYNDDTMRINLLDVTFTIPVKYDSVDRKENLELCVQMLQQDFDTNIIIGEQGTFKRFENYAASKGVKYHFFQGMEQFHRTRMLNKMAVMSETPLVANWDADVIVPPLQIFEAVRLIKERRMDMVYPYDGRFARVHPRKDWAPLLRKHADAGMFGATQFRGMGNGPHSVGGAVLFATEKFMAGGMENEYMISYAPEDSERFERFNRLGFRIDRIKGVLYHIDHAITHDSSVSHMHYNANVREYQKIQRMSNEELRDYVRSWPWMQQYRPSYYESIHEEAMYSRDEVFKVLREYGMLTHDTVIVDVGAGLGSWGYGLEQPYVAVDHGVPKDKLFVDAEQYIDHDLRTPGLEDKIGMKAGLVLCLEVAEHLEYLYADQLVDTLCALGDTILFSAAIPGQGGVQHYNEQWQSYWADKFALRNFYPYHTDIREDLWDNDQVGVWYRQNMVIYCRGAMDKRLSALYELDRVHPKMWTTVLRSVGIL
jgi:hypothetical protein